MPSKSEPCGLAQMVACRYGTPPIVRETGGLRDSIHDSTMGDGNGFTFAGYNAHELYVACCNAQDAYNNKENWKNLVRHCMECDFSWDVSAKSYEVCTTRPQTSGKRLNPKVPAGAAAQTCGSPFCVGRFKMCSALLCT